MNCNATPFARLQWRSPTCFLRGKLKNLPIARELGEKSRAHRSWSSQLKDILLSRVFCKQRKPKLVRISARCMSNVVKENLHSKGRVAVSDGAPFIHWHAVYRSMKVYENIWYVVGNIARTRNGGDINPVDDPMRIIAKHGLANDPMLPGD
ncbi:hypothetical protein [Acidicapsa acidisoli]|uniref:hypothetical protein n=1 Tax=Acidicapsa acidisoli TaxID=1615681 RepID=UPI00295BF7D6|nr:hypothetical protein [Acidicapsa acidisoli]